MALSTYIEAIKRFKWLVIAVAAVAFVSSFVICQSKFLCPYNFLRSMFQGSLYSTSGLALLVLEVVAFLLAGWFSVKKYGLKDWNGLLNLMFLLLVVGSGSVATFFWLSGDISFSIDALGKLSVGGASFLKDLILAVLPAIIQPVVLFCVAYYFMKHNGYSKLEEYLAPSALAGIILFVVLVLLLALPPPFSVREEATGIVVDGLAYFLYTPNLFPYYAGIGDEIAVLSGSTPYYNIPEMLHVLISLAILFALYLFLYSKWNKKSISSNAIKIALLLAALSATGTYSLILGNPDLIVFFVIGAWVAKKL